MGAIGEPAPRKPLKLLGNLELVGNLAPATTSFACSCEIEVTAKEEEERSARKFGRMRRPEGR